tara:strand:+ start:1170 stop:1637 length:468 start_codon:yes stop_codon:yes gene_type:complete
MKSIPSIIVPIIENEEFTSKNLFNFLKGKRVIIFGVPGAFTPTCSEKHLPGFIQQYTNILNKGVEDIFCFSVNDPYVMKSWLSSFEDSKKIKGIADGNTEITKILNLHADKSENFMGVRCLRFAMEVNDSIIVNMYIEAPGKIGISSAENILKTL